MKGKLMNKIATWLAAGVIVATAAACSVTVNPDDGGAGSGATGGTGGSGATGGSGGSGGSTGGSGGTAGTGGASGGGGSAGTAGAGGSGGSIDAGSDANVCSTPTDRCGACAYSKCMALHCECNGISTCRSPMIQFYMCASNPANKIDECAGTFAINANVDGSGGKLAGDLGECMIDNCDNTCLGLDAGTLQKDPTHAWRLRLGHTE